MTFAADTAVTRIDVSDEGTVRFAGEVHEGWDIGGNANGGYLLAIAARAMRDASGRPDPVSITAHYLRPGKPGPVSVEVEPVKEGKLASAFMDKVDLRLHPDDSVFSQGQKSGAARMRGWFAWPEGADGEREEVDTICSRPPTPSRRRSSTSSSRWGGCRRWS